MEKCCNNSNNRTNCMVKKMKKIHAGEHKKISFVIIENKHGCNHNQMNQQWQSTQP